MSLLNHRNLPELLAFIPPYSNLAVDGDYIVCTIAGEMGPDLVESLKLRFGFQPGVVTPTTVRIHKTYLLK